MRSTSAEPSDPGPSDALDGGAAPPSRRRLVRAAALADTAVSWPLLSACNPGARRPDGPQAEPLSVPQRTYEGESPALIGRLKGTLVAASRAMVWVDLATLQRRAHELPRGLSAVSEVDSQTRVIRLHRRPIEHDDWQIERVGIDGQRQTLLRWSDDRRSPARELALSFDGQALAYVSRPGPVTPSAAKTEAHPAGDWSFGPVMLLNLQHIDAVPQVLGVQALATALVPHVLSWFADNRRLAVVTHGPMGLALLAQGRPVAVDQVPDPQIVVVDTATGTHRTLGPGRQVWVSVRGNTVLARQHHTLPADSRAQRDAWAHDPRTLWLLDPQASSPQAPRALPRVPAEIRAVVGWLEDRYLVYRGAVTPGAPSGLTVGNSPLVGPKLLQAVKVMDVQTGEFVTVLEGVDPRIPLSVR